MDVLGGRLERQVADPRGVVNAGKSAAEGPGARPQLHAPPARGGWAAAAAVEQPDAASRLGVGGYRWVCAQGSCEVRHVVVQVPAVVPEPGADPLVRWAAGHTLPLARRWLVMDIESTGLSRRTSLPVVVGVLYAEAPDRLHIEQAWLRSPDEEPALLAWWLSTLGRFEELVTYNGRNFDLRLLRSRLKVHGMPSAAMDALGERTGKPGAPHLDLLLWLRAQRSHGLPRLRLTDVEEGLLGLVREGDPGGAAVATLLQASLAAERCPPNEVFLHNQLDLIAVHRACSHLALPARS